MSRLSEMQEMEITRRIQRLEAKLIELKTTPQPTSNRSGVLTYQVPESDGWQTVEWTDHNDNVTFTNAMTLPPLPKDYQLNNIEVTALYTPHNQDNPIVYPYLSLSIDGAEWSPYYSPSLGLGFKVSSGQSSVSLFINYNRDDTDYSVAKPTYKFYTSADYGTSSNSHSPVLRVKFRLRSTDKGTISVKVKTYKGF